MDRRRRLAGLLTRYFLIVLCILLAMVWEPASTTRPANPLRLTHATAKQAVLLSPVRNQKRLLPSRQDNASAEARFTAWKYLHALLEGRYELMWSLLHPQMQEKWQNEARFATFWQTRFQDYTLQGFTLDQVKALPFWIDPETLTQYTRVEEIPVSLHLVPDVPASRFSQLPPEDQHPSRLFAHLPFVVQQGDPAGNWLVLDGGPADLEAPLLPPSRLVSRTVQVPILMYHHIMPYSSTDPSLDASSPWVVPPDHFRQQMDYLQAQDYHTITFAQLFDALFYGGPLPARPIILTFDDGHADQYQFAYRILRGHHFSGMFYIITGYVGLQGRMTWPQLREMLAHGMQMGSHTVHHVDLAIALSHSEEVVQQELQQSQATLQTQLGIVIQQFCYPYGDPFNRGTPEQQRRIISLLAADGYVGATTAFGRTGSLQESKSPLALLRIGVFGRESFQEFMNRLLWKDQ